MKTKEEIEFLKQNWKSDPCWDIEETEGFEEHKDELKSFRVECEQNWDNVYKSKLQEKATKLGIPDRLDLVKHLIFLEEEIINLRERLDNIE